MLPRRTIAAAKQTDGARDRANKKTPTLEEFLSKNDWSGALGLLQFQKNTDPTGANSDTLTMWMVYCAFHLGDYKRSIAVIVSFVVFDLIQPVFLFCSISFWMSWLPPLLHNLNNQSQCGIFTRQSVSST